MGLNEKTAAWINVCNPGYFGAARNRKFREYDMVYGAGNWRIAWRLEARTLDFLGACAAYEEAYYMYLSSRSGYGHLAQLLAEACDVYDDQESNVLSGLDYSKQETDRTHIQDIAIRRVVQRLGLKFKGSQLIRIRDKDGKHPLSMILSPGSVPFHMPELILAPPPESQKPWWKPGSVEDFYQRNKVLQVHTSTTQP